MSIPLLPPRPHRARRLALILLALAPFAFGALAVALGQDANWDLRNYHWYNAYAFLNGRYGFDILPSQTPFFYNPALDVPFYLLATHVPAKLAGFALGFVQGLNFILLFMLAHASLAIAHPRNKVMICAALAALGMLGGEGITLLGTTFYDNVTSLGMFLSALLVIGNFERLTTAPAAKAFILAFLFGLPPGLMMGLKLPGVIFCIGLCFALLGAGGAGRRRLLICFAFGCGVMLGLAITYGPWAWFLVSHYGNPLFPYFNAVFKSPLYPPVDIRDTKFVPRNLGEFLLYPFIFAENPYRVGEIAWRDWRLPILYALLPLALALRLLFGRAKRQPHALAVPYAARYLLWTAVISYFAWLALFGIYRYAVPLEMLAPLLIVFAIGMLPLKTEMRAVIAGFVLLAVVFSIQPGDWHRRAGWSGRFAETDIPPLGDTSNLMILMAGTEPYSNVVPQFPPEIPFVRIESNLADPSENNGLNQSIRARVAAHKGRFMLLIPPWQKKTGERALGYFQLAPAARPCQTVTDRLYDDKALDLCPVVRLKE